MILPLPSLTRNPLASAPSVFSQPSTGFIQMNFDEASKGNPGPVGYAGIVRNSREALTGIYTGYCGHITNNIAELTTLEKGLILVGQQNCLRIHIVGDSKMGVQMAQKIINRSTI